MPAILERSTLLRHTLFALVGIGVLLLLIHNLGDYRNSQLAPIAYTVCAAAGLTMLVGQSGQISLGHGAFMAVGAYTFALLQAKWTSSHPNVQLVGLLAAGVVVAAVFGAVVGVAAARLRGPYLAGATLALALGLPSLASYEKLSDHLGGSTGLNVTSPNPPTGVNAYRWQSIICCVSAVLVLWFLSNLSRSRVGRSFRAVRDDEVAAALCGLSVARVQVLAFVVSAGCAGLAGGLLAIINLTAGPGAFPLSLSLSLLAAIVFGGLGSMAGAAYGSVLVVMLNLSWAQTLTDKLSIHSAKVANNMPLMIYGVVLAVAMLAAPYGVQGALHRLRMLATGTRKS
ncbi:MAG: branched-chain amino acid transport system permease protein [Frankiaceae bacterium]|nr:branched-chain amino acid transport system permease protein [Frankiaceae bacterium]